MKTDTKTKPARRKLTAGELDSLMPPGERVHTFLSASPSFALLGCGMDRGDILALVELGGAELAGGVAASMSHGAVVYDESNRPLFIETLPTALAAMEAQF